MERIQIDAGEMYAFYKEGHTLAEVGEHYGISKQRVSKVFRTRGWPVFGAGMDTKQAILNFIAHYHTANGVSPSYAEIAIGIGRKEADRANVRSLCNALVDEGFLEHGASGVRDLVLTQKPPRKVYYKGDK